MNIELRVLCVECLCEDRRAFVSFPSFDFPASLVPETCTPVLPKWTAARLHVSTHDERFDAPLDGNDIDVMRVVGASCYKLFLFFSRLKTEHPMLPHHSPLTSGLHTELMTYDCMALLNAWNALLLGMLHLAFRPSGSSSLNTGPAQIRRGRCPWGSRWGWLFGKETLKSNGHPPPETQLYMGQVGGILVLIGLFALMFTTYASVPWVTLNSNYRMYVPPSSFLLDRGP
ncbi:hypothetical protein FIBSPDRAFT_948797 [Athelia psychrophila]|uniref:Uncharacterized protein n=1 Tax=Athelia psychrophila TaxID=1759441 RepID=A0A166QHJ7_9AGAM|nr:hypothetical protein FIBSPDRAFT_948797 [Fibularhizoctonia sp. CBS 109695]